MCVFLCIYRNTFASCLNSLCLWYLYAFVRLKGNLHLFMCECMYVCAFKWLCERYVWAWMLICVFVSDKQLGNGIRMCVRGSVWLHVSVLCLWGICMCVHIRGYMLRANMNMQSHLVFHMAALLSVKYARRESLSSWKACMPMRQTLPSAFSSLSTQSSYFLLHSFFCFNPPEQLLKWSLTANWTYVLRKKSNWKESSGRFFSAINKTSCSAALRSPGAE